MRLFRSSSLSSREQERIFHSLKNYKQSFDETEVAKVTYCSVSPNDREKMFNSFRKWLDLFCYTQQYMIDVVKIFSPEVAKILLREIEGSSRVTKEMLDEKYWEKNRQFFSKEELNEFTKEMLDLAMERTQIHSGNVNTAFVLVFDTLKYVGIEMTGKSNKETQVLENIIKSHTEPLKETLSEVQKGFAELFDRYKYQSGLLSENMAKDFYKNKGYNIIESVPYVDQKYKIDFVATKEKEIIAVQVKTGQVSSQDIFEIFKYASKFIEKEYKDSKRKIITIIAKKLPENYLKIKEELKDTNVELDFLTLNQVSKKLKRAGL